MRLGPGAMVAAAFIGPGTVTTAAMAGATSGGGLIWAVVFSVFATMVLQELAMRSALVTRIDLAGLMRKLGRGRWWGPGLVALIVVAIGVGNAAYQSGNLSGAGLGLSSAFGLPLSLVVASTAMIAGVLIYLDSYRLIEQVLVMLVAVMALLFCGLAVALWPEFLSQPIERLVPNFSPSQLTLILALIGTTVVPYNLFLHASAVMHHWSEEPIDIALAAARKESTISILIGGVITIAIVVVASAAIVDLSEVSIIDALILATDQQLPGWGKILIGTGLFAAGITSSITAPIAAGWAVCGAMGWSTKHRDPRFRVVALTVLLTGSVFALLATKPTLLIITAQATNALLLPIIAIALLFVSNSQVLLNREKNGPITNVIAIAIVIVVTALALPKLIALVM